MVLALERIEITSGSGPGRVVEEIGGIQYGFDFEVTVGVRDDLLLHGGGSSAAGYEALPCWAGLP